MPSIRRNKWRTPSHMWSLGDWANEGVRMLRGSRESKLPRVELRQNLGRYFADYKKDRDAGAYSSSSKDSGMAKRKATPKQSTAKRVKTAQKAYRKKVAANKAASKPVVKRRRGLIFSAKSSGFFKKGTRRVVPETRFATQGVVVAQEFATNETSLTQSVAPSCLYIGHCSFPVQLAKDAYWAAFVKAILRDMDIHPSSVDTVIVGSGNFYIRIRYSSTPNGAIQTLDTLVTAGTSTLRSVALVLSSSFVASNQYYFKECIILQVTNGAGDLYTRAIYNLQRMRINFYAKSALKLQNRTVTQSNDDNADDVDNVPLYGKSYEGAGTGAYYVEGNVDMVGDEQYGFIKPFGSLTESLNEPPNYRMLKYVKKHGKAHLDPGQLKTSVLNFRKNFMGSYFYNSINRYGPVSNREWCGLGNFRVFALEKMIMAESITEANKINVALELDTKLGCIIKLPKYQITTYWRATNVSP